MTELRPCVITVEEHQKSKDGNYYNTVKVQKEAAFHRFGDSWTFADDAKIPNTVAIVELKETGEVYSVDPTDVRFTDS